MNKPLYHFFEEDHRRIDALLDRATENPMACEMGYYERFRKGLLRHIKMEEKILFPAAQEANGGTPLPPAARLRLDHGALTMLMVVPPSPEVIRVLRHILTIHDEIEEKEGGMYEACENLTGDQTQRLLEQLEQVAEVPVHPHNEAPYALEAAKRAVERAGFDYDKLAYS